MVEKTANRVPDSPSAQRVTRGLGAAATGPIGAKMTPPQDSGAPRR
jgi:hypothetical protein